MAKPVHPYNKGVRSIRPVSRARAVESMFRAGSKGREPLAPPGEGGNHIHYASSRRTGIGSVTSRKPGAATDEEYLAWLHGLTVAEVRRIMAEGHDDR